MSKFLLWLGAGALGLAVAAYAAFQLSPWPNIFLIRYMSNKEDAKVARALEAHAPAGVAAERNLSYDPGDKDALLDVYYPATLKHPSEGLTTIVWVHGGGWLSGSKDMVAPYARILAARGYTVATVGYSLAPEKTYPVPIRQVNAALHYLAENARKLHVEPSRFVLAGDSAGAQIAAQTANVISAPYYAESMGVVPSIERRQLQGTILFCGAYDLSLVKMDGPFHNYLETVLTAYTGVRDFATNSRFTAASVAHYVTADFPPTFISAGNRDPLLSQSTEFAKTLASKGVVVDSLFFPADYKPPAQHEYQFDLDSEAGKLALARSVAFLSHLPHDTRSRRAQRFDR